MAYVGLIINPISGTDIRRLTSHASFIDNNQKAYIASRIIKGLDGIGISKIYVMPDFYGVAQRALSLVENLEYTDVELVDMNPSGEPEDTVKAVEYMVRRKVSCIVLLGGDGTVRVASKASRDIPLLPISTGTNNVIPFFIDGSVAAILAGAIALNPKIARHYSIKLKKLDVLVEGRLVDHALVDVASTDYIFRGSKALIDIHMIKEAVVSISSPLSIGLAGIAGMIKQIDLGDERALYFKISDSYWTFKKKAIIAPGIVKSIGVSEIALYKVGDKIPLETPSYTIALDGEREVEVYPSDKVHIYVNPEGPYIVNVSKLARAISEGHVEI